MTNDTPHATPRNVTPCDVCGFRRATYTARARGATTTRNVCHVCADHATDAGHAVVGMACDACDDDTNVCGGCGAPNHVPGATPATTTENDR